MNRIFLRLRYWWNHGRMAADLAEEMEFHRAMLAKHGRAPVVMGNATLATEAARGVWIWPWLESLWQDAAYAVRTLRRQPAFTITALLALGSAIGLNASFFAIFNAVALRPWPVREPARMVTVQRVYPEGLAGFGIAQYRYLAEHSQSFSGLIAMRNGERVKIDDQPGQLTYVSGNYFRVLGVEMERGRGFLEGEDRVGAPQAVVVIGHDLWQNRFGGDPLIVGRSIRLDGIPFTIVGVTPADFTGTNPLRNDLWTPLSSRTLLRPNDPSIQAWLTSPSYCCTPLAGRLSSGVTRTQAQAELAILLDRFQTANSLNAPRSAVVLAGTAWMDSPRKKPQVIPVILALFLAVTLVLLLACANVGNLLLARASARRREIAVRLSLGGGRSRILRQLLVESTLLALAASALGFATALVAPAVILRRLAPDQAFHTAVDLHVLAYMIAVVALSCLAFGLAPVLHGVREGISTVLKTGADPGGATQARFPLRSVLLAVQVGISVVLLANAGLLVQAMRRAQAIDPGFDVRNVTLLSIDLPASEYVGPRTQALTSDLLAQLERSKDPPASGLALNPPLSNSTFSTSFRPPGLDSSLTLHIYSNEISGRYLDAVGMRLLAGRTFVPEDTARKVVMINEAAVRRWWRGENPVGNMIFANGEMRQIVGIVSDTYANDLSSIEAVIYFPITGHWGAPFILAHDRSAASVERIAAMVKQIEPRAEIHAEPLADNFNRKLEPSIYGSQLAGLLGLLALAIASVGMSGVFAYVVGQRTREIGVRMALGAQPSQIVRLVLGSSARALASGLVCGIVCASGISVLLAHGLPGIRPLDPLAYSSVVLVLSAAVALASAAPARRASKVDPVRALRWE